MPPFSHILNDDEVAAVVTYIRVAWEQQRHAGDAGPGQRAAQAVAGIRSEDRDAHRTDRPPTRPTRDDDAQVDEIVSRGPAGAFAVAGIATAIVVAIFFAFYFFVFLPRGAVQ